MSHISNLTSRNNNYAIIVAGGSGSRMQSTVPKQFLLLNERPVLMYTVEAFYNTASKPQIILVLAASYHAYWVQLCADYNFSIPHQLVTGGDTRFHSVKNALDVIIDNDALIAVHDAVRPLTNKQIIDESYIHAAKYGNAVTAVKSRDSIRQLTGSTSRALPREEIYLIQTPQTFSAPQITKAYLQPYHANFTDDASVVEQAGFKIHLIEGDHRNIKITFPEDIAVAELFLNHHN